MKKWPLILILMVLSIAPILYGAYHLTGDLDLFESTKKVHNNDVVVVEFKKETSSTLTYGSKLNVIAAQVIDGCVFILDLDNGDTIEAHLCSATKPTATKVVFDLLNSTKPPLPTITVKRKFEDYWFVKFELTVDGNRVYLLDYLRQKDLLL